MNRSDRSLRVLVEKWLGDEDTRLVRVARFSRGARRSWRYVRVEATRGSATFAIVFFRHDDGSWCVYPPAIRRPAMAVAR